MIHSRKITDSTKNKFKYLYLEGMIKFLKMYAVNELGSNCDLDLYRIAMYINSVRFENEDVYEIKSLDDIYNILTEEVIYGFPIWRFLKVSSSQLKYLESEYSDKLTKLKEILENEKSCRMCYFYRPIDTPFGFIEKCYKRMRIGERDSDIIDSRSIKSCEYFSRTKPEIKDSIWSSGSVKEIKLEDLDEYRISLSDIREINDDLERAKDLDPVTRAFSSIGMMMNSRRGLDDRDKDSLKALQFSILYRFMEVHLLIEYGNAFEPNVARICKDIYEHKFNQYRTEDDFIKYIEDSLIKDPRWATKYSKKVKI